MAVCLSAKQWTPLQENQEENSEPTTQPTPTQRVIDIYAINIGALLEGTKQKIWIREQNFASISQSF